MATSNWPNAANTGVPVGITLTTVTSTTPLPTGVTINRFGDLIVNAPGVVLSGLDIKGSVYINASNVTLINSKVTGGGDYVVKIASGVTGTVIQNSTISGGPSSPEGSKGIAGSGTFIANNISNVEDGIFLLGDKNTLIQDNYIHDLKATLSPHYDGIQIEGSVSNVVIRHNTVINDSGQTSAVMIDNYFGPISNITVDNNLLVGGGYTIYVDGQFNGGSITGVSITNNHMGTGSYGITNFNKTSPVYTGNVNDGWSIADALNDGAGNGGSAAVGQVIGLSQDTDIAGDFITSVADQTVNGTYTGALAAGDVIQVSANGSTWVSATAGAGTWTAGVTLLPGEHTLAVRTVDDAGNIVNGIGHAYDLDLTGSAAVGQVTGLSQDTGIPGDFITSVASQTVNGTYTGTLAAGDVMQVSANGSTWVSATAGAGTWTAGVTLLPGEHSLSVRTVDDAGNIVNGIGHPYDLENGGGGGSTIFGTAGADRLVGTAGADTMAGLGGNDEYIVNNAGDVVVEASGQGTDTVLSSVSYSLADYVNNLTLTGSGNINGTGNSLDNVLVGNSGSNILLGGAGNDLLSGGPEIDWAGQAIRLYVGVLGREPDVSGFDHHVGYLRGGRPLQTAAGIFIGSPEFQANIGSLNDTQFVTLLYNNALHRAPDPGGLDNWVGALGNGMTRDALVAAFVESNEGKATNKPLVETFIQTQDPGQANVLDGGDGTDTVSYNSASGGVTVSLAITGPQETLGAGIDKLVNVENLTGSSFNDTLTGNAGANTIVGGAGNDVLTGGAENDTFVFDTALNAATNVDDITDFNVVNDTIRLENAIFSAIAGTGTLTAAQFTANTSGMATDSSDRIIYETDTGKLFYDSNGNAAGGVTQFALLNVGLALTNSDFFVI